MFPKWLDRCFNEGSHFDDGLHDGLDEELWMAPKLFDSDLIERACSERDSGATIAIFR